MIIEEIVTPKEEFYEAKLVYARSGKKVVRKYRCSSGRLKGKTVKNPSACFKPVDVKKKPSFYWVFLYLDNSSKLK